MTEAERPTVLAVDDDPDVVELYRMYLDNDYDVRVATNGEAALDTIDGAVDVVMLDRRLPDLDGRTVLDRIRARDLECRIVLVTAVEPDFDIIEMAFDDYLVKPVREEELHQTVEHLLARLRYDDLMTEYYRVASKVATLKSTKSDSALQANEEFVALEERARELRREVSKTLEQIGDFQTAFEEVAQPQSST